MALPLLGALAAFWAFVYAAPLPPLDDALAPPGTVVLAADGTVLQRDARQGVRIPVTLDEVAPQVVAATLAAEDHRFFDHVGIDPFAVGRALVSPGARSGASTITMQLARRLYLGGGEGWLPWRKAKEAGIALWIEAHYSKEEILEAYLNDVSYGRGAYGIEAAARLYFGVSAANLDLARAAFLAGIPQDPARNSPDRDFARAKARQHYVLGRLFDEGEISPAQFAEAVAEPLHLLADTTPPIAPHFVELALAELAAVAPELSGREGLIVETTLDAGLQAETDRVAAFHLERLEGRNANNAAVVVLDPRDGSVLALAGHVGDQSSRYVNLATALRQPGSALKPILYALALERGMTLATPLLDVPTTVQAADGPYAPQNYDRRFHGPVPMRIALASSYNVPAVRTLDQIGIEPFLEIAARLGLRTLTDTERYGPSIVLGGGEVRLIDLVRAYAVFANGGERVEPSFVVRVRDGRGRVLYERPQAAPVRVIDGRVAWLITDALRDGEARIPGFGPMSPLESAPGAAVKTGTTTGFRDNWAVGYTPAVVVGAWVGNADGSPMRDVSGVAGAGPIWRDVLEAAVATRTAPWPQPPPGLVRTTVCNPTGMLPGPECPAPVEEWFVAGTEPHEIERYYVREGGRLAIDPPPEARAWAADAGMALATAGAERAKVARNQLRLVQPPDGAVFVAAPELESEQLLLRATAAGATTIEFWVDGQPVGGGVGDDVAVPWTVRPGRHEVEVRAYFAGGAIEAATHSFEVQEP